MIPVEGVPRIAVAVLIRKDGKILLGSRKKFPLGWGSPGGKMEFGEEVNDCVLRETREEVGIKIKNIRLGTLVSEIFKERSHHVLIVVCVADYASGTVQLKEPDKHESWKWVDWNNLPFPLSPMVKSLVEQKFDPFR